MADNDYHIVSRWKVAATIDEVVAVLEQPLELPRWWAAVYLEVVQVKHGGEHNVGAEYDFYTKGWLPYTLRWRLRIAAVEPKRRFEVEAARGDFAGQGV